MKQTGLPEPMRTLVGTGVTVHGFLTSGDPRAANLDLVEQQMGVPVRLLKKTLIPAEVSRIRAKFAPTNRRLGEVYPSPGRIRFRHFNATESSKTEAQGESKGRVPLRY
jgi:hypothetical protein